MKKHPIFTTLCAGIAVVAVAGAVFHSNAQVKQGKTRLMKTAYLMKGVVKPNCGAIKKGLEAGPADDDAWAEIVMQAALLNEASYILMEDGRCPDGTWADAASKTLRDCSAAVVKAAEEKNLESATSAFKAMTQSCKKCHDAHKEKE